MWAVSKGSYSDYSVVCLCRSKAEAETVLAKMKADIGETGWCNYSDAFVESFPVATPDVEPIVSLLVSAKVWDDGTASKVRESTRTEWPFDAISHGSDWRVNWRWCRPPRANGKGGRLDVRGTDHDLVRKVFSEKRAQLIAGDGLRASREKSGGRR